MKILFASSECAPYVKTGGLGDVAAALPKALAQAPGAEVYVFLPFYKSLKDSTRYQTELVSEFTVPLGWRNCYVGLHRLVGQEGSLQFYFVDNEYYFYRDGSIYGHLDDGERFAYFSKAILESLMHLGWYPDVIHCNDWQTALVPVFLQAFYQGGEAYSGIRTVYTIHNIEYQGWAGHDFLGDVMGLGEEWRNVVAMGDAVNFMKAAILAADKVSTVSRTYAYEIQNPYFAHGLDVVLRDHAYKLTGVVNGIDTDVWNSATDPLIYANFDLDTIEKKAEDKRFLQERLGLAVRDDVPLIIMITRLAGHKGLDLIQAVMDDIISDDLQMVVIGTGEAQYEDMFRGYAYAYPAKMSANIVFDNTLAHQAYAGGDIVLMPSKQEPCGLTQLIAMRYGTASVVRETGGLYDTVPAFDPETGEGRGFTFKTYNAHDMLDAIRRACKTYQNKEQWAVLQKNLMTYDCSWNHSVQEYWELYRSL